MHSADFEYFKLYADNTLKQMTKTELIDYIHMLHYNWGVADQQLCNVIAYNKKLDQAYNNAIKECCYGVTGSDACNPLDELYKAFEKKVWQDVK